MEYKTKRLDIKKFIPEYIPIMFNVWGSDREVGRYMPEFDPTWDLDTFTEHIMHTFRYEDYERCIIKERKTNEVIGYISIFQEDSRSKSINIYLKKDYWNKGYGTEAIAGLVEILKAEGIGSIYATCDNRNVGASRVLENNKFECIDVIKGERIDIDGKVGDELLYELELIRVLYNQ